jgi:hypothetical protein
MRLRKARKRRWEWMCALLVHLDFDVKCRGQRPNLKWTKDAVYESRKKEKALKEMNSVCCWESHDFISTYYTVPKIEQTSREDERMRDAFPSGLNAVWGLKFGPSTCSIVTNINYVGLPGDWVRRSIVIFKFGQSCSPNKWMIIYHDDELMMVNRWPFAACSTHSLVHDSGSGSSGYQVEWPWRILRTLRIWATARLLMQYGWNLRVVHSKKRTSDMHIGVTLRHSENLNK